jgi:high-affinity iron transporter
VIKPVRFLLALLFAVSLIAPLVHQGASAQDQSQAKLATSVNSNLVDAQRDLMLKKTADAQSAVSAAWNDAQQLASLFIVDAAATTDLNTALDDAATAVTNNDEVAFAVARGKAWTAILRGAMAEAIAAAKQGNADAASAWLLVREFRPTTKFSRPGADATLAVKGLRDGSTTPDDAAAAISADLLDTYQGLLDASLTSAATAVKDGFPISQGQSVGEAFGYWQMLAPEFESQRDATSRADVDTTFESLVSSVLSGDTDAFLQHENDAAAMVESFRATPMSAEEQANRAHQLLLYLSLVSVEYGRGVKGEQVVVDIEIVEAQAFIDAARAAFADLRPALNAIDQSTADQVATALSTLNDQIQAAGKKESVVTAGTIKDGTGRVESMLKSIYPADWKSAGGDADFEVISSILDQMETAVAAGQYKLAESSRLQAYAIYESGPEKHLLGFAPNVARQAEELFWQGNGSVNGLAYAIQDEASPKEISEIRAALDQALADGQRRLGAGRPGDGAIVFNAATIVFREGLEAVLILASLLASMIGANARFKKPLSIGAIGALVATAVLFVLARTVLLSLNKYGEKLEAIVSLVAIGILLLVMNWFFHKVYWTKWIAHHHTRRRMLIGGAAGQMLGLVILGFTSVFREGAETVLFLQALVLDAGTLVVIEGVALGLVATAVVGALVFGLQARLPHKKMLTVTGVMIALVLVMMVGNTVHVMQVVGWMPINPIGNVIFPYWAGVWLGAFATWQGVVLQAVSVVFVIGSYFVAEWQHERTLQRRVAAAESEAALVGSVVEQGA